MVEINILIDAVVLKMTNCEASALPFSIQWVNVHSVPQTCALLAVLVLLIEQSILQNHRITSNLDLTHEE